MDIRCQKQFIAHTIYCLRLIHGGQLNFEEMRFQNLLDYVYNKYFSAEKNPISTTKLENLTKNILAAQILTQKTLTWHVFTERIED